MAIRLGVFLCCQLPLESAFYWLLAALPCAFSKIKR
jgi:hypothetical protein